MEDVCHLLHQNLLVLQKLYGQAQHFRIYHLMRSLPGAGLHHAGQMLGRHAKLLRIEANALK